jgi:tetratricopeptide (TPR) repeat protein
MRATSLKKLVLLPPLQDEEKQLNKFTTIQHLKKAGLISCLFLCFTISQAQQKEWLSDKLLYESYTLALTLKTEEARKQLSEVKTPEQIYVASLADVFELLVTEDEVKFEKYEDAFESRLDQLEKINPSSTESLFAIAELRLQWAFIYLKFGYELDAAWNVRQAYLTVQECKKKYPDFLPIKKTSGLLEIMLGSVPEKYQWVMSMLNMEGSVDTGLKELEQVRSQSPSLNLETTLLYYLFQGFILQQTESAMLGFEETIKTYPGNRLALFLGASIAVKNSQSEKALVYLKKVNEDAKGLAIPYSHYQLGEVYLHKGEYDSSARSYQKFLNVYRGQNYIKDAHYKIGICYWMMGNDTEAEKYFEMAKEEGKESTEADKYAARSLAENTKPNVQLSKLRYATDGGYYENAKKIVSSVGDKDLQLPKEKIEFTYRKGRLHHKSGSLVEARKEYLETVEKQGEENWYFAPNACLQLGYLFVDQKQPEEARKYFEKALGYKKHEYKNSIDSKAKSALAQLKKK